MGADVELLEHAAAVSVNENYVVGQIVSNEELVRRTMAGDHSQAGGIRNSGTIIDLTRSLRDFLARRGGLRRNFYKTLPRQLTFVKAINRNAVSRIVWLLTRRVGDGADRGIKMFVIGTEGESKKIALVGLGR